jgi:hypothetical protein
MSHIDLYLHLLSPSRSQGRKEDAMVRSRNSTLRSKQQVREERSPKSMTRPSLLAKLSLGVLVGLVTIPSGAQRPIKVPSPHSTDFAALATPTDWGEISERLFEDLPLKITFKLTTSWIPGEAHSGSFRYRMTAVPERPFLADLARNPNLVKSEVASEFVQRVSRCNIHLLLNDVDGFKLRSILVPFSIGQDDKAHVGALLANDAVQMGSDEYRHFLGNDKASGSWTTSWACPDAPR